jgi:hypothetical protein
MSLLAVLTWAFWLSHRISNDVITYWDTINDEEQYDPLEGITPWAELKKTVGGRVVSNCTRDDDARI